MDGDSLSADTSEYTLSRISFLKRLVAAPLSTTSGINAGHTATSAGGS